jgi:hypothetical protein
MPVITGLEEMAADGCLVKPLLHQFILDPGADVQLNLLVQRPAPRVPDGRFHASQHPLATERELYLWMTGGGEAEEMGYVGRASVMFGSLAHAVIEAFLDWTGFAVPLPPGLCPSCGRPRRPLRARPSLRYCTEHGYVHEETRASCHLDSILDFSGAPVPGLLPAAHGFDFKTIRPLGLKGVKDMDLGFFREKWPHYWAQGQECMRISGLRQYIFLFFTMGNPWDTREFHIPFDPDFAAATDAKYKRVIYHLDSKVPIVA